MTLLRNLVLALVLLSAPLFHGDAGRARAQDSASAQFTITGKAPNICVLPAPVAAGNAVNATYSANTISLTQFINPNTALVNPSSLTVQFPNTLCNYTANVSLSSKNGGLTAANGAAIAGGSGNFLQNVPYTVTASWGSFNLALDTSASGGNSLTVTKPVGGANAGSLMLSFAIQASTLPVAEGTYTDTVTVKIGATL